MQAFIGLFGGKGRTVKCMAVFSFLLVIFSFPVARNQCRGSKTNRINSTSVITSALKNILHGTVRPSNPTSAYAGTVDPGHQPFPK